MSYMFQNCRYIKSLDILKFDTSNVINMNSMFANCKSLEQVNLTYLNTSNVHDMGRMFQSSGLRRAEFNLILLFAFRFDEL